jgi:hypothetical protein
LNDSIALNLRNCCCQGSVAVDVLQEGDGVGIESETSDRGSPGSRAATCLFHIVIQTHRNPVVGRCSSELSSLPIPVCSSPREFHGRSKTSGGDSSPRDCYHDEV